MLVGRCGLIISSFESPREPPFRQTLGNAPLDDLEIPWVETSPNRLPDEPLTRGG